MNTRLIGLFCLILILAACTALPAETLPAPGVEIAQITVYFLYEAKYAVGTEPYEVGVIREVHPDAFLPRLALQAYFEGPAEVEKSRGLVQVLSGCTGFSDLYIEDRVAHVTLTGPCNSGGSTYTIAQPVMKTLRQFDEIEFVKLYDQTGITEIPTGRSDSIPFVLEP